MGKSKHPHRNKVGYEQWEGKKAAAAEVAVTVEEAPAAESVGKKKKRKQQVAEAVEEEPAAEAVVEKKKKKRKAAETVEDTPAEVVATKKKKKRKEESEEQDEELNLRMPKAGKVVEKNGQDERRPPREPKAPVVLTEFRLFVSGIPKNIDEATLRRDFEECGEIANLKLMLDGQTWQSRGIAFISFKDEKGMNSALDFDGDDYGGRKLSVKKAEAKGSGKGSGPAGPKPEGCNSVVLKRLSPDVTEEDLTQLFKDTNPIKVGLLLDRATGKSRCTARIDFKDGKGVDEAVKLGRSILKGSELCMDYCQPKW